MFNKNSSLKKMLQTKKSLSLSTARIARRSGFLKRATDDLYQNIETGDFWKINEANNTIERIVKLNDKGFVELA